MTVPTEFSFRVLTVNTHKGFTFFNRKFILHELRDAVRSVSADVVFLQEVQGLHDRHHLRFDNWTEMPHYEFLADAVWPEVAYGRNAVYPSGHHGNAVLSKFTIVSYTNRDVSVEEAKRDAPERRGMLHCVLRLPVRDLEAHAFCVHLGLREGHREQQLQLLCKMLQHEVPAGAPVVVAGDFNDWRCRAHGILTRGASLREVFVHSEGRAAKTFPARLPFLQLDRIYVRNARVHAPVVLPRKPWSHLSDHAPLAAEIVL